MPRYLGINYWQQAIDQRREFYNRSLLTIPHYLEQIDLYVHQGTVNGFYDKQSIKALEVFEDYDDDKFRSFVKIPCSEKYGKIESFNDTGTNYIDDKDEIEVIPSSNPESQKSTQWEAYKDVLENKENDKELETFQREDLDMFDEMLKDKDILEEVLCIENNYKVKLPHLQQLAGILQPKDIKDPLCNSQGQQYTEQMIFMDELKLNNHAGNPSIKADICDNKETFNKIKLEDGKNDLEELISPISCKEDNYMISSIQVLLENSQPDSQSPMKSNLQICDEMKEKLVTATECIENDFGGSKETIQEKEFREINEEGQIKSICLEDTLIESPLFVTESLSIESYTKTQLWNFDHIQSFAMPSLKTKKLLLRDTEEKFLLKKFWQQEKYHDEDLCIRLQVPDISNGMLNVYNVMMEMKTSIQITNEANLGAAELKLSWDPFPKNVCCTSTFDGDKLTLNPRKTCMIPSKSLEDYKEKHNLRQDTADEDYLNTVKLLAPPIICQGQFSDNFDSTSKDALNTKVTLVGVHHPAAGSDVQYSSLKNTGTVEKVLTTARNSTAPVMIPPLIPNSSSQKLSSLVRHTSSTTTTATSPLKNTHSASLKVARTPLISTPALEPINTIVQPGDPLTCTSQLLSPIEVPTNNSPSESTCTTYTMPTSFTALENNIKPLAINVNSNSKSIGNTVEQSISGTLPVKNSNTLPILPEKFNPPIVPESIAMETNDSLDMFLAMLSSGVTQTENPVNVIDKSVKEEIMKQVSCKPTLDQPKQPTCNKMSTRKHNRLVSVQLSGPFEEIYKEMETFAKPYISLLKLRCDLPRSFELKTTTSDSTRFLLKQKEKQLLDTSSEKDESYKALLVVHCIKVASDNVLHACLESAISHLSFIQDRNNVILGSCLNDLRQRLFHQQYRFQNNNTVHPKILAVCREANGIIQSKTDDKVLLVVVKRPVLSLMTLLKDNLAVDGTIRPYIVTDNDDWTCLRNSTNNCMIVSQKKLQDIDLSDVECLFEYESSNESMLKGICENQETNFIGFTTQNFLNIPPINDMTKTKQGPDNIRDVYKHFQPITVIGSTSLTQHEDILHILESKYDISVIERDYSVIQELKSTSFADIILDQNQAILLKDLLHLTEESNIELVTRQLASFALKYKKCWIILFMFDNTKGYPLSSQVLSNLFKLEAALANMSHKGQQDVAFKVLLCHQKEDICCIVREICDMVCQSTLHENLERPWLAQTMSKEEKMLLCIPCLNSFSSQLLLKKASLKEIITMSLEDLHHLFPEIPYKVLEAFYKVFNNDNGLQLQPTPSSQQLSESDEYHIIHNGLESPDMYSEPHIKNRDVKNESRLSSMHNTDNNQRQINNCDSPSKRNYRDNVYSGQLISKRSLSEDFLVDLTSDSQNSSVSDSQDMSDKPNQYVVAELEGREFYNKLADNNSKSSEWLNTKSDMYTSQCNIQNSAKNCGLKKFHYLKNDTQSKYMHKNATMYASYSEPEIRNLDRELDKNIHDIGFDKYRSEQSSNYTKIPHNYRERQIISPRKQPHFPHLSQAWSNLSDYHSAINTYRQTSQRSPEKAFPPKTCIPIESNQTVKRLQERNAIDISGISIRDKIQVYENNDNRQFEDSVSTSMRSQRDNARQSCCFSPNASSSRKIARFSADLTSTTRNLLRRPVLHETLQNNLLHPSVQRISVGLAQPLRRVTENQETSNVTNNLLLNGNRNDTINSNQQNIPRVGKKRTDVPFLNNRKDTVINLPYNRDMQGPNNKGDPNSAFRQRNISTKNYVTDYSPPMDLDSFSPTTEDQMSRMFSEQNYCHRSMTNIPTVDETRVHHVSGENSMSNIKRSKLSYKPIPGRKGGQTVLSFN